MTIPDKDVSGERCSGCKNPGLRHTNDCLFQHFLSYTGYGSLDEDTITKLKVAYEHGVQS